MCQRINSFQLKHYAQLSNILCPRTGNINLVIGENGTGKSTLLKALYTSVRSAEEFQRGDDRSAIAEVLAENIRWTFQVDKLGDLVTKGAKEPLRFSVSLGKETLEYSFTSSATAKIVQNRYTGATQNGNSIFIPAKDVLSLQNVILRSREVERSFGFDNTCYDLVKALRIPPVNSVPQHTEKDKLEQLIGGRVEYDEKTGKWLYKKGNAKYSINTTSEGVKKIAILEHLLANGFLNRNSILFLDEPEASLHPTAISVLLEVLDSLAYDMGMQIFIASHSYFVIKKLRILAMKRNMLTPCISLSTDSASYYDLSELMPENSIVRESIRLYEEEIKEVLG